MTTIRICPKVAWSSPGGRSPGFGGGAHPQRGAPRSAALTNRAQRVGAPRARTPPHPMEPHMRGPRRRGLHARAVAVGASLHTASPCTQWAQKGLTRARPGNGGRPAHISKRGATPEWMGCWHRGADVGHGMAGTGWAQRAGVWRRTLLPLAPRGADCSSESRG